jgi:hypothetical protein
MDVRELSRDQLIELKCQYMAELVNEGTFAEVMGVENNEPSYGDLAEADQNISDEFIFEHYNGVHFVNDDFFCTAN